MEDDAAMSWPATTVGTSAAAALALSAALIVLAVLFVRSRITSQQEKLPKVSKLKDMHTYIQQASKVMITYSYCSLQNTPPVVAYTIPFLGSAIEFGKSPVSFLIEAQKRYGNVFSIKMVGKTFTYLIGSDTSALFFDSRNDDLNAEEVYSRLVTPVFGKGVAYDVPHNVRSE